MKIVKIFYFVILSLFFVPGVVDARLRAGPLRGSGAASSFEGHNQETITNDTNGEILFSGVGGTNNEAFNIDLETSNRAIFEGTSSGFTEFKFRNNNTTSIPGGNIGATLNSFHVANENASGNYVSIKFGVRTSGAALGHFGLEYVDSNDGEFFWVLRDTNSTSFEAMRIDTDGDLIVQQGNIGIGKVPTTTIDLDEGTGWGQITADGSSGGCLMMRDTDDGGWTECSYLNGTQTCTTDADGVCDGS